MSATTSPPPQVPTRQEQEFKRKAALVTGATKGISRATCLEVATQGASILGTYSSDDLARDFEAFPKSIGTLYSRTLQRGPAIIGVKADISLAEAPSIIMPILHALRMRFDGKVDIVVFNAAVMTLARMVPSPSDGEPSKGLVMESLLKENVFRRDGRVIKISSGEVRSGVCSDKGCAGVSDEEVADELDNRPGMEGTTFNSVSVGFTKTAAYDKIPSDVRDRLIAADAAEVADGNRTGEVEDISGVVGLLVSEKARWMSGSIIDASGGKVKIL